MNLIKLKTKQKYTVSVKPSRTVETKEQAEKIAHKLIMQTGREYEILKREYAVME